MKLLQLCLHTGGEFLQCAVCSQQPFIPCTAVSDGDKPALINQLCKSLLKNIRIHFGKLA